MATGRSTKKSAASAGPAVLRSVVESIGASMHIVLIDRNKGFLPQNTSRPRAALLLLTAVLGAARCGPQDPQSQALAASSGELMLAPSNPQIAQGTAQQFSFRARAPDGHLVDLTAR